MLAELGLYLPERLLREALTTARAIETKEFRAQALAGLGKALVGLSHTSLGRLWNEILHELAARTREHLLSDLRALASVLTALGGESAVAETFCAIQDVGRWWP